MPVCMPGLSCKVATPCCLTFVLKHIRGGQPFLKYLTQAVWICAKHLEETSVPVINVMAIHPSRLWQVLGCLKNNIPVCQLIDCQKTWCAKTWSCFECWENIWVCPQWCTHKQMRKKPFSDAGYSWFTDNPGLSHAPLRVCVCLCVCALLVTRTTSMFTST